MKYILLILLLATTHIHAASQEPDDLKNAGKAFAASLLSPVEKAILSDDITSEANQKNLAVTAALSALNLFKQALKEEPAPVPVRDRSICMDTNFKFSVIGLAGIALGIGLQWLIMHQK